MVSLLTHHVNDRCQTMAGEPPQSNDGADHPDDPVYASRDGGRGKRSSIHRTVGTLEAIFVGPLEAILEAFFELFRPEKVTVDE